MKIFNIEDKISSKLLEIGKQYTFQYLAETKKRQKNCIYIQNNKKILKQYFFSKKDLYLYNVNVNEIFNYDLTGIKCIWENDIFIYIGSAYKSFGKSFKKSFESFFLSTKNMKNVIHISIDNNENISCFFDKNMIIIIDNKA